MLAPVLAGGHHWRGLQQQQQQQDDEQPHLGHDQKEALAEIATPSQLRDGPPVGPVVLAGAVANGAWLRRRYIFFGAKKGGCIARV